MNKLFEINKESSLVQRKSERQAIFKFVLSSASGGAGGGKYNRISTFVSMPVLLIRRSLEFFRFTRKNRDDSFGFGFAKVKILSFLRLRGASGAQGISTTASCRETHKRRFIFNPWILHFAFTPLRMTISVLAFLLSLNLSTAFAETTCTWEGTKLIIGGSGTFNGCDSVYDDDDNEIDWYEQQEKITEIEFGDDITEIDSGVFENIRNLMYLDTNNIKKIGYSAFEGSSGLTSINMPNVTDIGECAFCGVSSLTSAVMSKVERIGNSAFESTKSLTQLDIPDTLKYVGSDAFRTGSELMLIIPDTLNFCRNEDTGDCWDGDALADFSDCKNNFYNFKCHVNIACKGDSEVCKNNLIVYTSYAWNIDNNQVIFDNGNYKECLTFEDNGDDAPIYYHTGTECAELPESGNITCASGYADYNGNCYAQLPFSKKRWTPAEASKWLHDGNDNFVVLTFKK